MTQDPIARFKQAFHPFSGITHLNNAGVAPLSTPAYESVEYWAKRCHQEGMFAILDVVGLVSDVRRDLASFLGANPEEVGFFQSTAGGLSQIAFGMDLKPGDEILIWDQEYPSNFYPWKEAAERAGAKVVVVPSGASLETSAEAFISHATKRTRVMAFSWVQYQTGAITDLQAITSFARSRGIFTVADIVQGAGLLPFHFHQSGLDAASGGSHKWLVSPVSIGYLLLREEHLEKFPPSVVGAMTYATPDDRPSLTALPRKDAQRFEPGSKGVFELMGLGASVRLFQETGIERISQEIEWLSRKLMHGLRERGYLIHSPHGTHHRGSIINFSAGTDSKFKTQPEIEQALLKNRVSFARRAPGTRLSPHAFNTEEDIARVLGLL